MGQLSERQPYTGCPSLSTRSTSTFVSHSISCFSPRFYRLANVRRNKYFENRKETEVTKQMLHWERDRYAGAQGSSDVPCGRTVGTERILPAQEHGLIILLSGYMDAHSKQEQ